MCGPPNTSAGLILRGSRERCQQGVGAEFSRHTKLAMPCVLTSAKPSPSAFKGSRERFRPKVGRMVTECQTVPQLNPTYIKTNYRANRYTSSKTGWPMSANPFVYSEIPRQRGRAEACLLV